MRLVDKSSLDEDAAEKEQINKPQSNLRRHESTSAINNPIVN